MPTPISVYIETEVGIEPLINLESGNATLGREPENSIVIDSAKVSRRHACFVDAGSQWLFCDLASTNGSWLNGVQVHPDHLRLLRDADIVQVGDIRLHVQLPRAGEVASSLLIFSGERFEDEFVFTDDQTQCIVGGPDSHVSPGGEHSSEDMSFAVSRENGRLDLNTGDGERVSVNG
ncbi:MAG: FHA domain-containing protein, partial [Deltaproteobacteria bacterium]|nr:FHA domain-containing protein [Deltaproteobacteria bacterium]